MLPPLAATPGKGQSGPLTHKRNIAVTRRASSLKGHPMKNVLTSTTVALCAAFVASPAAAREDSQLWTGATATVKLDPKWRISQELIGRFSDNRNGLYEVEAVTLLGYKLNSKVTLAGGYVHNPLYAAGDFTTMEHRAREQVTVDNIAKLGGGSLSGRLRLEQRWRENVDGTAWRMRPYLKYSHPLVGKTSLTLSSEAFVNLKKTPFQKVNGLDRFRNLVAVNVPLSKQLNVEAGYLNQYGIVRGGPDNIDHVASISLGLSL